MAQPTDRTAGREPHHSKNAEGVMDLWITFLALSVGVALVVALIVMRSRREDHAVLHDLTPPMGHAPRDRRPSPQPPLRRMR